MPETQPNKSQEIAVIYAAYLGRAKARRKAVRTFALGYESEGSILKTRKLARKHLRAHPAKANSLSDKGRVRLDEIYEEQFAPEWDKIEDKRNNFSNKERAKLILKARLGRISGLTSEENKKMHEEVDYDPVVTGKSFMSSLGCNNWTHRFI